MFVLLAHNVVVGVALHDRTAFLVEELYANIALETIAALTPEICLGHLLFFEGKNILLVDIL